MAGGARRGRNLIEFAGQAVLWFIHLWFVHLRKFPDSSPAMVKHSPVLHGTILYFANDLAGLRCWRHACCWCFWHSVSGWWKKACGTRTVNPAEIYRLERGTALWNSLGSGPSADTRRSPELGEEESANEMDPALRLAFGDGGYDAHHSPLWYLIAAAPLWLRPVALQPENIRALHWSAAVPYLGFGLLLGASLWYVARRLFGNAGGYVALALYCFSPGILRSCALWFAEPEAGAAWGAFGAIFTAIAVAHTLVRPA